MLALFELRRTAIMPRFGFGISRLLRPQPDSVSESVAKSQTLALEFATAQDVAWAIVVVYAVNPVLH